MKWFLAGTMLSGIGLVWLGNLCLTEPNQSADVREGGMIPIFIGGALILIDLVIGAVWLVARA